MKLDPDKFKEDESKSNPMVVAMAYPECPMDRPCFYMVIGSGAVIEKCPFLKADEEDETAECTKEEE